MKFNKFKFFFVLMIVSVLFIKRNSFLIAAGNFLIKEEAFTHIKQAFVLSGGAYDRGNHAANLINEGKIDKIVCTGANQPPDFKALKIDMLESELTRKNIITQIQDSTIITLLKEGTSTREESEIILEYCLKHKIKECVILSSKFHTKRIHKVFKKKFKKKGIKIYISGAASSSYDEKLWWKSENGLISLNNEYIKLMYYAIKY